MNVLVTGAAGFIGSHVADRLLADGHNVVGIDNLSTGRADNFAGELHVEDICDRDVFYGIANKVKPDLIIHCAASYSNPKFWHRDTDTNVTGTINATIAAIHHGAHLVYFQTSLCYGSSYPYPIRLDFPLAPSSSYAISKVAGERYIRLSGCDAAVFRLANMYGPRNLSGPVPAFWKRLSAGEACTVVDARRDFVHVSDLVRLVLQAVDERACGTWHASTGTDYAIVNLWNAVVREGGFEGARRTLIARGADDVASLLLDPSATRERFGWEALVPLDVGIRSALEWYEDNPVKETWTHLRVEG